MKLRARYLKRYNFLTSNFQLGSPKKGGGPQNHKKKSYKSYHRNTKNSETIKHKLEHLEETDKILETHNLSTLNNEEADILNWLVTS